MESLEEIKIRSITGGNFHRLSFVFHILWNGTPTFWNYHSLILDTESYQLSTNGIEQTWAKPTTARCKKITTAIFLKKAVVLQRKPKTHSNHFSD